MHSDMSRPPKGFDTGHDPDPEGFDTGFDTDFDPKGFDTGHDPDPEGSTVNATSR